MRSPFLFPYHFPRSFGSVGDVEVIADAFYSCWIPLLGKDEKRKQLGCAVVSHSLFLVDGCQGCDSPKLERLQKSGHLHRHLAEPAPVRGPGVGHSSTGFVCFALCSQLVFFVNETPNKKKKRVPCESRGEGGKVFAHFWSPRHLAPCRPQKPDLLAQLW